MNKTFILAMAGLGMVSAAFAFHTPDDALPASVNVGDPLSRAQVVAELMQQPKQAPQAPVFAEGGASYMQSASAPKNQTEGLSENPRQQ